MKKQLAFMSIFALVATCIYLIDPSIAFADFESSLGNIQDKLINTFLPILAVIGLALAGISFASGNPNAKQHIIYAVVGCIVGFSAEGLVNLIRSLVS